MKVSLPVYCNDFLAFLLFLRLALVTLLCFFGGPVLSKAYGYSVGLIACLVAFPLWWYHFGLPRFHEERSGIFSARFCLWGYLIMAAVLVVVMLLLLGVLKEGQPHPIFPQWFPKSRTLRFCIIFAVLSLFAFARRKPPKSNA
jgi:membrane protease YdiL (CAAX protease family)